VRERKGTQRDLLERALERLERGEPLEACLRDLPEEARADLADLLETARSLLETARSSTPDPAVRERVLRALWARHPRRPSGWVPRLRRTALTVGTALLLALALGTAWRAGQTSLPGQPLYPLRQAGEQARLLLTPSPGQRALLHAQLAHAYAGDAVRALERGRPALASDLAWRSALHLRQALMEANLEPLQVPDGPPQLPPRTRTTPVEPGPLTQPVALPARQVAGTPAVQGPALLDALWARLAQDSALHRLQALEALRRLPPGERELALRALRLTLNAYEDALARVEAGLRASAP